MNPRHKIANNLLLISQNFNLQVYASYSYSAVSSNHLNSRHSVTFSTLHSAVMNKLLTFIYVSKKPQYIREYRSQMQCYRKGKLISREANS